MMRPLALLGLLGLSSTALAQDKSLGIIGSVSDPVQMEDVRLYLLCTQPFFEVIVYDASAITPTLDDIARHDALLIFNETGFPFGNPAAVGDIAQRFLVDGGGVVLAGGALDVTNGTAIGGQLASGFFMPLDLSAGTGVVAEPGLGWRRAAIPLPNVDGGLSDAEWITYGLNEFNPGSALHVDDLAPTTGSITVAEWIRADFTREPLVTYKEPPRIVLDALGPDDPVPGRVVALNFYPPSDRVGAGLWDSESDADQMVSHAIRFSMRDDAPGEECPDGNPGVYNTFVGQDYNCNGIDVNDEPEVDITDPLCMQNIDPLTNEPYLSADYYYDYDSFGCLIFTPNNDLDDEDLLGGGTITIDRPDGHPTPWATFTLCDNCREDFNPDQLDIDCDGTGDLCDVCVFAAGMAGQSNQDQDCWGDDCDNCPQAPNDDQSDLDLDGLGDACDICPETPDDGADDDGEGTRDGVGNACDNCTPNPYVWPVTGQLVTHPFPDLWIPMVNADQLNSDNDPWGDACDNCPFLDNRDQVDRDEDGLGDACDLCPDLGVEEDEDPARDLIDSDGDGLGDGCDTCVDVFNPDQQDLDLDRIGDACDNCPGESNREQEDRDGDGIGDFCDFCPDIADATNADRDGDGVGDGCDNCPDIPNTDQDDRDGDGVGDNCDTCILTPDPNNLNSDNDAFGDVCDNCPFTDNPSQLDSDGDGLGDECDALAVRGGGPLGGCSTAATSGSMFLNLFGGLFALRRRRSKGVV